MISAVFSGSLFAKAKKSKKSQSSVRVIQAVHTPTNVPDGFLNEDGKSDGFEVAVLSAVGE